MLLAILFFLQWIHGRRQATQIRLAGARVSEMEAEIADLSV